MPVPSQQDIEMEKAMYKAFATIAGEDLEVDAYELQVVLTSAFAQGQLLWNNSASYKQWN
jgi:hypothetical protein